jgi:hypothetical protein
MTRHSRPCIASVELYSLLEPPAANHLESHGTHIVPFTEPDIPFSVPDCVKVSIGVVRLPEIVPLTPRFISVGFVILVDSAKPSFMPWIFFVLPAAVAALA